MKTSPHTAGRSLPPRGLYTSESGNALIELAFSLPLFLLLVLGTAEIANLAWSSVQVNNAARAGAAYAAQSHINSADTTNIGLAAQNEAPKLITNFSQVTSTQLCYCVPPDGSIPAPDRGCTNTTLSNCPSPGTIQVAVQVNVQAPVTPFVHYPGLPATYTVHAQATMGVAQ